MTSEDVDNLKCTHRPFLASRLQVAKSQARLSFPQSFQSSSMGDPVWAFKASNQVVGRISHHVLRHTLRVERRGHLLPRASPTARRCCPVPGGLLPPHCLPCCWPCPAGQGVGASSPPRWCQRSAADPPSHRPLPASQNSAQHLEYSTKFKTMSHPIPTYPDRQVGKMLTRRCNLLISLAV